MPRPPRSYKPHPALNYKEPTAVRASRYALRGGLVCLLFIVVYVAAWFLTSMTLRASIQDWFDARAQEGYVAEHADSKARISGFPFKVEARIYDVRLAAPENAQKTRDWSWVSERVTFSIIPLPWTISMVNIDLSAGQTLTLDRRRYAGKARDFQVGFNWRAQHIPERITAQIAGLRLVDEPSGQVVQVSDFALKTDQKSDGMYGFDMEGKSIDLPRGLGLFGPLSQLLLRGELTAGFGQEAADPQGLTAWRDRGGTLEMRRMQIETGPLFVQGNGTVALDQDLQIVGAFSARIEGFFEALNQLARRGIVRGPDASMARVVLGVLAKQPENGGPATISLPLTVQDQALYTGPVRLIELPKINW